MPGNRGHRIVSYISMMDVNITLPPCLSRVVLLPPAFRPCHLPDTLTHKRGFCLEVLENQEIWPYPRTHNCISFPGFLDGCPRQTVQNVENMFIPGLTPRLAAEALGPRGRVGS